MKPELNFYPDTSGVVALVGYSGQYPKLEADVKREASCEAPDALALGKRIAEGLGVKWMEGRFESAAAILMEAAQMRPKTRYRR